MMIRTGKKALEKRKQRGMNQADFWGRVGATQSAGSRYEQGRRLPNATQVLLTLAYANDQRVIDRTLRKLRHA